MNTAFFAVGFIVSVAVTALTLNRFGFLSILLGTVSGTSACVVLYWLLWMFQ